MATPRPISADEWSEIAAIPEVRALWGLADDDDGTRFASICYGARFNFVSGGTGYCGDLFVVHGDSLSGPPVAVIRKDDRHLALLQPGSY